ncbi:MAG: FKBP-type peptidyl-prolyl cis-trans isomerase [Ardenticatenaceae bacterium]|nr:FKBP-type peptidyl-prolyl cis-trans isomerase [Ardenticatenaceae bacterium]
MSLLLLAVACGPAEAPNDVTETAVPAETGESDVAAPEIVGEPAAASIPIEDAISTESGLQYIEVEAGDGAMPQAGDIVEINFIGTLEDGTVFGDTYSQGGPITVILGNDQLLPGWEEGVMLMHEGGKIKLVIPPELGFGAEGAGGGFIPPDATLIMDVELLSVTPPPEPTAVDEAEFTTTDSGLQYYDLVEGDGDIPETGDSVTVNFTIWLNDDQSFITSSLVNGSPLTFVLGRGDVVFPGWDEGVSTMQVGGSRQLIIPSDLGLGDIEAPGVPAGSSLLMEVELLSYQPSPKITEVDEADYTVTDTGLKYYDLVEGDGPTPEQGQTVVVHYTGWLEDGTVFDTSLDSEPFSFVLGTGSVIAGWDEGLATMKLGSTRQLVIPSDLAYGDTGGGSVIPPGATLIFEVELLEIR